MNTHLLNSIQFIRVTLKEAANDMQRLSARSDCVRQGAVYSNLNHAYRNISDAIARLGDAIISVEPTIQDICAADTARMGRQWRTALGLGAVEQGIPFQGADVEKICRTGSTDGTVYTREYRAPRKVDLSDYQGDAARLRAELHVMTQPPVADGCETFSEPKANPDAVLAARQLRADMRAIEADERKEREARQLAVIAATKSDYESERKKESDFAGAEQGQRS